MSDRQLLSGMRIDRVRKNLSPETRLTPDAIEPCCQIRPCGKIELGVGGDVAVRKNGYVRDRIRVAGDEWSFTELTIQNIKRAISERLSRWHVARELVEFAGQRPVSEAADRGLDIPLLEHQPADDLRAGHTVARQVPRPLRKESEYRIRFGKIFAGVRLENGHASHRVLFEKAR
jgi:hypothetical protein